MFILLHLLLLGRLLCTTAFPDCSYKTDGHFPNNGTLGPYAVTQLNVTYVSKPMVVLLPTLPLGQKAPLMVFMHGITAQIEMYLPNLMNYASNGFVVVFPYIKGPKADRLPIVTNTNGEFILRGIAMAKIQNANVTNKELYNKIDMNSIVVAGHSMGATCSIMAGAKLATDDAAVVDKSAIKLVITQHPGICGPFGPPPWPSTWMQSDLTKTIESFPILFTTATNDAAFWPKPMTASHEFGCYSKATQNLSKTSKPAIFIEFGTDVCLNDGGRDPFDDSGHDCVFKTGVETPWVLTFMKHYAMFNGNTSSKCYDMINNIDQHNYGINFTVSR